ncbi:unnamed protein product [Ilex paraguariensis]|uniref:Uncharacterized protein n=1 Tax=Ilex paraguariensis TaxID=185542 RepID=A0ABC8RVF9_9AQUA
MRTEKGPGVKILWLWAIGTAAVLVTSVARTRIRDMEQLINAQEKTSQPIEPNSGLIDTTTDSTEVVREEKF